MTHATSAVDDLQETEPVRPTVYRAHLLGRRLLAGALLGAVAGSFAMSAVLFLTNGGASQFSTIGETLLAIGILAALLATTAMLWTVLLAARLPVIDWVLGQDRATRLHAAFGEWVVLGVVAHAIFVLTGYALLDKLSIVGEFTFLWADSSDFILAVFGILALFAVAITSVAAARRFLPYEAWRVVHLLSYAAIGLSIPHMFSMSGLLAQGSWQRRYWIVALVITGTTLAWCRILTPIGRTLRHRPRVHRVEWLHDDTYSIEITGRRLDRLGARPGQFFRWRFLGAGSWWHDHPFSLSAAPTSTTMRLTVRVAGRGTAELAGVAPGTPVAIEGPYGTFTHRSRTQDRVVLIGAGAGIAPIRALLEDRELGEATVILRDSHADRVPLRAEVERLCRERAVRLSVLTGARADEGWLPAADARLRLVDLVPDLVAADLFVCGPPGFVDSVVADARSAGVPGRQIHYERFAW